MGVTVKPDAEVEKQFYTNNSKFFFLNMQNEKCAKVRLEEERGIRRTVEEKLR